MYPQTVLILLGVIMGTALVQYYILVPSDILNEKVNKEGYWGATDADFDWCEYNHLITQYIAEPWNSLTSLIYIVVSCISMHYTSELIPPQVYTRDMLLLGVIVTFIGAGSALFHATLLYRAQLLDEMPMHWLVCYCSVMLYTRSDYKNRKRERMKSWKNSRNFYLNAFVTVFCVITAAIVWSTSKHSFIHKLVKFSWGFQFVTGFTYCFYVVAKLSNDIYYHDPNDARYRRINKWFDKSFFSISIALIGWLCDNCYCQMLQNLQLFEFSVPYLHFHAFLWHIGTCIGLHYFLLVVLAHRIIFEYRLDIKCTTCLGTLPYIGVNIDKEKKKRRQKKKPKRS